jgi:hypothetical protein
MAEKAGIVPVRLPGAMAEKGGITGFRIFFQGLTVHHDTNKVFI